MTNSHHAMMLHSSHKGNKAALASKTCLQCARLMTWRKAWAKNWNEVKYCSNACRTRKKSLPSSHHAL